MSLRARVALELATLAVLASVYLLLVPERPVWMDAGLALVGVALVAATARATRERVWTLPTARRRDRLRHSSGHMLVATSVTAVLFAVAGGWGHGGVPPFRTTMVAALVLFIPWAMLQQMLLQFYLLGRLRVLAPAAPAPVLAAVNGLLFGACHLPDVELTVVTTVGGAVWSWYYMRDRILGPIALSHAVLGTTYFYWVRDEDLVLRAVSATGW